MRRSAPEPSGGRGDRRALGAPVTATAALVIRGYPRSADPGRVERNVKVTPPRSDPRVPPHDDRGPASQGTAAAPPVMLISEATRLLGPSFLVKDFLAQIDALVADLDSRPGGEPPDTGPLLATEAAFRLGLDRSERDQLDAVVGTLLTAQNR